MRKITLLFLLLIAAVSIRAQENFDPAQLQKFPSNLKKHTAVQGKQIYKQDKSYTLDTMITAFLAEINPDSVSSIIQSLQDMGTRFCFAANHNSVRDWIIQKYLSLGIIDVVVDSFKVDVWGSTDTVWRHNVIATILGSGNPNEIIVVGGHYDSYSSGNPMVLAPGADDNASSQACNFEIARAIMHKEYVPEKTIKIISFDAEELGLYGSFDYAFKSLGASADIQLMINTDMISNNTAVPSAWNVTLNNYDGCDWAVAMAHSLALDFTALNPVDEWNNSSGSDSYPFWAAGYPVLYFEENEFSPVYHSVNDVLANCDVNYCAEIIRLAAATLLNADRSPSLIKNYTLQDAGTGTALLAKWNTSLTPDVAGYRLFVGTTSGSYANEYNTTDTTMLLTGLTQGVEYFVGLAVVDADTNLSPLVELSATPLTIPLTPSGLKDASVFQQLKIGWNKNHENDLLGYNVYRSSTSGTGFVKVNTTPVPDTAWIDPTAVIHTYYYYEISAIDSVLNESPLTTQIRARVLSFDQGILVVNDSHGGVGSPTDVQVNAYYDLLLNNYSHTNMDASASLNMDLADFATYSTIIWHSNLALMSNVVFSKENLIRDYLSKGGHVLFTMEKLSKSIMHNVTYPVSFYPTQFIFDVCGIESVKNPSNNQFWSALPVDASFDTLFVDTLKTPATNMHHFSNVEAIIPAAGVDTIYEYHSLYASGSAQAILNGEPVGIQKNSPFEITTLSFPLYYMGYSGAKNFIDTLLINHYDEVAAVDDHYNLADNQPGIHLLFPNPSADGFELIYSVTENGNLTVDILNLIGQNEKSFVVTNAAAGKNSAYVDTKTLSPGMYFCVITQGSKKAVARFVVSR
ncbi:MAG: M28 family peptidase [Bacteroidota bacterium]